jgi:hypothetical protein
VEQKVKEKIKDLPMGILIMVVSNFFLLGNHYVIMNPNVWFAMPLIIFCSISYWKIFNIGWEIAFEGVEVDTTEKQ